MRTIKFRGKDSQGEWHYGYLVIRLGITYIFEEVWEYYRDSYVKTDKFKEIEVSADTVGQFVELYDKYNNEIYEDDIVDVWSAGSNMPNGIIKWSKYTCSFFIGDKQRSRCWQLSGDNEDKETLVIVGNIHDNPELLKGGENE